MKKSWTNGLEEEAQRDVRANFREALVLRKRLKTILEEKMQESWKTSYAKGGYENQNWAYLQADARGYERALSQIIELLVDNS